jgi:hypothetical protein
MNKVFGIGLSRTGTTTLNNALNILGIKSIHYPRDPETFRLLSNGIVKLPILEEYDGLTDVHTVPFYPQFDEMYPGSKFILTTRDIEAWLPSVKKHLLKGRNPLVEFAHEVPAQMWLRTAVYGVIGYDESVMRRKFYTHQMEVMDYFKDRPEDLLVMDICRGNGWNVLCPFLGFDKNPSAKFPTNIKSGRAAKKEIQALEEKELKNDRLLR